MIQKLWCWLFGHKRQGHKLNIEKSQALGDIVFTDFAYNNCPRCGKELD